MKTIDDIVSNFVIKTLPTVSGDMDHESLKEMIQAMYANTSTLKTTPDFGKHVHIGLIIKDTI